MSKFADHVELVRQAQLGDETSVSRLAELCRESLYSYVYRSTLRAEVAQEIHVLFNNNRANYAVTNARQLLTLLSRSLPHADVVVPETGAPDRTLVERQS